MSATQDIPVSASKDETCVTINGNVNQGSQSAMEPPWWPHLLTSVLADVLSSPDFERKFDSLLERCGDVKSTDENGQTILHYLAMSARNNREFLKVLNILQNDPELRPLIFEHEALLKALKDMGELKAE